MIIDLLPNLKLIKLAKPSCNIYLLSKNGQNILIDSGAPQQKVDLQKELKVPIDVVINTHVHWDHTGNNDLFAGAKIYCESADDSVMRYGAHQLPVTNFRGESLKSCVLPGIKCIPAGGHSGTDYVIYLEKEEILFTGDVLYSGGVSPLIGLPTEDRAKLIDVLESLRVLNVKLLCPGHGKSSESFKEDLESVLKKLR